MDNEIQNTPDYNFDDLVQLHGSAVQIPHEALYEYINHEAVRGSVANVGTMGLDVLLSKPLVQEVRRRTKTDLYWVAKYFCWETNPEGEGKDVSENKISKEEYGRFCDFFIRKDESKPLNQQDTIKTRLLLWPRGGFKSTIDICDAAQWILNFPSIRILFLTAADDLATGFVGELKSHFFKKPDSPTLMNLYFPEFCTDDKSGNEYEFTCPVWAAKKIRRKEPTVLASSLGSTKSGLHFELIKADDAVSDKNSESADQCQKVSKQVILARKLLRHGGYYLDMIGTRYADEDHYGITIEKNVGDLEILYKSNVLEISINHTTGTKTLIGRGIQIKPEVAARLEAEGKPITYIEAGKDGCDILIPSVMSYAELMQAYSEDEVIFEGQINQNPRPASNITFERSALVRATVPFTDMPHRGPISQTWDFAFSRKKGRDYSTASSAIWNEKGQMFIHDMIRSRFRPHDLARAVVDFAKKWRPFIIGIEDAAGSRLLEPTIIAEAVATGDQAIIAVCSKIDWFPPENQKDAKKTRMATLHPWLVGDRLKFANYLPFRDVLYDEFEKCLGATHHDDIPDVISQQPRYAPRMQQLIDDKEIATYSTTDAMYNLIFEENTDAFGRVGYGTPAPVVEVEPEPEARAESPNGLDPVLGAGLFG